MAVVGLGCVGLSASYYLSKQGLKVIGLEQYPNSGHEGTNSFGHGRIWRHIQTTQEATDQMIKAQEMWVQIERESGQ